MSFNYTYVIDYISNMHNIANIKVLDFGCGPGDVIEIGISRNIDIYGVDIFQGLSYKEKVIEKGLFGTKIFELEDSKINFPDNYFDVVIANQVFEHVDNLENALSEITRVLKKGGKLLALFPTTETWIEVHAKIPFVHKIRNEKLQLQYLMLMRYLLRKPNDIHETNEKASKFFINWMNKNCHYRSIKEIYNLMSSDYHTTNIVLDYVEERLNKTGKSRLRKVISVFPMNYIAQFLFQKLGGYVIVATKHEL